MVAALLVREYNDLLLDSLSPPLATVAGADSAYLEYLFAVLLTRRHRRQPQGHRRAAGRGAGRGAGRRGAQPRGGTRGYLAWSVAVAFLAGAGGLGISTRFLVPTGGAVVLAVSVIFFLTLIAGAVLRAGRRRGLAPGG